MVLFAARCMAAVALLFVVGCSGVGPDVIRSGRPVYNEAIAATNNEQLLAMIVRMRYQEPAGLLAVASVTANVRVQTSVSADFGYGPEDYFSGNLVPLSAGALFEDNPTISYTPVQGQEFLRQALSPLPLDLTVLLLNALGSSPDVMTLLIKEINGLQNPDFLSADSPRADPRFREVVELITVLHQRGLLLWIERAGDPPSFALVVRSGDDGESGGHLGRLRELLGLEMPVDADELTTFRVVLGISDRSQDAIIIRTRALFELFQIAAASVDIPDEHVDSGLAAPLPPAGPASERIRIHRSSGRPDGALVAVKHHGWWYRIDSADARSKATFRLLEALMTARMADATIRNSGVPVLTVPVSR